MTEHRDISTDMPEASTNPDHYRSVAFHDSGLRVEWVDYYDAVNAESDLIPFGGSGGFFADGMRWVDYLAGLKPDGELHIRLEAVRISVLANGLRHTGESHQHKPAGAPLLSDGSVGLFSQRAWGDLMAAIWSTADGKDYSYVQFYLDIFVGDDDE